MGDETKWINRISPVEAQQLTVRILTVLPESAARDVLNGLSGRADSVLPDVVRQLELCLGLSSELRSDPARYDSLEALSMAALRRQTNREALKKQEYGAVLGVNRMQRSRLEKGTAVLSLEQVRNLCGGFRDPVQRQFWENLFLERYPDMADRGREAGSAQAALELLLELLEEDSRRMAANLLDGREREILSRITGPTVEKPDPQAFGGEPDRLYPVLAWLSARQGMLIADVAAEEIGISSNTWYAWKKVWEEAERGGFQKGIPKNRLKRVHMILLGILFGLDYPQSVYFLALSGYRYVSGEPDDAVLGYLRSSVGSREELARYLKEGIHTGKW